MMLPEKLTENTNGYFSLKTAAEFGITRWQLQELLRNGEIQKVSYGLYALKNVIPDELFITQLLSPKLFPTPVQREIKSFSYPPYLQDVRSGK